MQMGVWVFVGWMTFVALSALVFLLWAWRSGQFKNVEEAKYRMLEEREPEPWPGRQTDAKQAQLPEQPPEQSAAQKETNHDG